MTKWNALLTDILKVVPENIEVNIYKWELYNNLLTNTCNTRSHLLYCNMYVCDYR
jgi:hypothetical protein